MQETPERMVENGKVTAFGYFRTPFRRLNIQEADIFGIGSTASKLINRFRLKDWQHVAIFGPDCLLTYVVFNAHYLSNSFCYFVDRNTGDMIEHHREGSPFAARIAKELWNDHSSFQMPGYRIDIENRLDENRHTTKLNISEKGETPGISADIELLSDLNLYQPLIVVLKLKSNRPVYSHKMVCPAIGRVHIGSREIELDPGKYLALIDVHKAYYPYNMTWKWASCAGFDQQGRVVGLNLTQNVIPDGEDNNENGLWIGKELSMFGAARFEFDESDLMKPWQIRTEDGRCRLEFFPQGERAGKINVGMIASDYHQPYGIFRGEAVDDAGATRKIDDFFGITEYHRARF